MGEINEKVRRGRWMDGWLTGCVVFDLDVVGVMADVQVCAFVRGANCGSGPAEAWRLF